MEKSEAKRRIVLVPFPRLGHITPMMQLGKALNSKGFSITVVLAQGLFDQVVSSQQFPDFQFVTIAESVPISETARLGVIEFLQRLNKTCKASFKDCIDQLLVEQGNDIACIIYDEFMHFCEFSAKEFKLPSVIFTILSATNLVSLHIFDKLDAKQLLVDMEDPELREKVVENLHPVRYKNLLTWGFGELEPYFNFCKETVNKRTASAVIINTVRCLENTSLLWLQQENEIQMFPIGPLHMTISENSNLLEEDRSCIVWLDKQKPKSVIFVSLGSLFKVESKEVLEMAWGLINSNQPFLWVIRQDSIIGSKGIESLPEEIVKMVLERGYIVKWAPQHEVLRHRAVGGFWSHCGWNSTLESIGEGVPMICRPFQGEQKLNAMNIESVWKVGIRIEGEVERGAVERVVKKLLVGEEGGHMRERALVLKENLKASVEKGGSSYTALDDFLNLLARV